MIEAELNLDKQNFSERIDKSITNGIEYLHDHQLPNGEFLFYMSADDAMQSWNLPESSVFPVSLIGMSLLSLKEEKKVESILIEAAKFLHYQMDMGGTWNHYTILHRYRKLCPQDLDDTACVSKFLESMGFDFPKEINEKLILDNRRGDGLFYTWLTFRFKPNRNVLYWKLCSRELKYLVKSFVFWQQTECSRYDVDAGVNANVLYYLGKRKETLPILSYLIDIIEQDKEDFCDKWYLNRFTIYYFISRNFDNGIYEFESIASNIIGKILLKQKNTGCFGESELDTALSIVSLINLNYKGIEIHEGINYLLEAQQKSGHWKRWGFYYTGYKKIACFGSEELTTAFCLEALAKYRNSQSSLK